ncbi:MAG: HD domain-containing protein [Oscillospiraceae bacterium]|nr:HD domain-containing protein [Oscillospiraceae bacterium]
MQQRQLIDFLGLLRQLKINTRHVWTSDDRQESVADHSFRLAVMALLLAEQFSDVDINKVVKMCLIHDFGEAITGDIPSFYKTSEDREKESLAVEQLLKQLPDKISAEFAELFCEMEELVTEEAKLFKALDRLEATVSHNESSLETWLPLEYTENISYGEENVAYSEYLKELKAELNRDTVRKIEEGKAQK